MSGPSASQLLPAIFGLAGLRLSADERAFFADSQPLGFILFKRNCDSPDQIRALTAELRASIGRAEAPILIDQEGGRVQRLGPPQWRQAPAASSFGAIAARAPEHAREACRLNARLLADDLWQLGINVDCLPCLDLARPETHAAIGDRAFAGDPAIVADLGRAQADGLMAGGVLPVMKHLPGHGRATADSHHELPRVTTARAELEATDFAPFRSLADLPMAMTAHIIYADVDAARPATQSRKVIDEVIRGSIGFDGLLMSDDLNMNALAGGVGDRATAALTAGCDVVLHCNGKLDEMRDVAAAAGVLSDAAAHRWQSVGAYLRRPDSFDRQAALDRLEALCAGTRVA